MHYHPIDPFAHVESSFVGPHYRTLCALGYPELDIVTHEDGSWSVLEMRNSPVVPALTQWWWILKDVRHQEPSESFLRATIPALDPRQDAFWEREMRKTLEMEREKLGQERFHEELVTRTMQRLGKSDSLKERVAKHGMGELDPRRIALRIARETPWLARRNKIGVLT